MNYSPKANGLPTGQAPEGGAGECWKCKLVRDPRAWAVLAVLVLVLVLVWRKRGRRK